MPNFYVSKVVIVDSLAHEEFQTGQEIENVMLYEFNEHNLPLSVERYSIQWAGEFEPLIQRLTEKATHEYPLLHIEMHGDPEDGLIFANNSALSWEEVNRILAPLNRATGFNLVCVFAACYGAYFTKALYVNYAAPCFALVAPEEELDPGEVHRAFRILYHNLAILKDMGMAADLLVEQTLVDSGWFSRSMDRWFCDVLNAYVRQEASTQAVRRRAKQLYVQLDEPVAQIMTLADMEMFVLFTTHKYVGTISFERFFMTKDIPENLTKVRANKGICYKRFAAFDRSINQRSLFEGMRFSCACNIS